MTTHVTTDLSIVAHEKESLLHRCDREHGTTMRVLRAYPRDRLDLRPHEMSKTARELGWLFVGERHLGTFAFNGGFSSGMPNAMPPAPESWDDVLKALEDAQSEWMKMIRRTSDEDLNKTIKFFSGPKMMGDVRRIDFLWSMLMDEIHHRGQFSIYLRMAGGKVPSIYGPSADEPWN
jgi:uncharacterized damage-inducible protein DinB